MRRKYFYKLLSCNLINKRIRLHRFKWKDNYIKFRFERGGSYLKEYYMSYKDSLLVVKLNNGNQICSVKSKYIVYSLPEQVNCIVKL